MAVWYHPEERRQRRLWAYYAVLGSDQRFMADLRRLYVRFVACGPPDYDQPDFLRPWPGWPALQAFADRWRLPRQTNGRSDVFGSLGRAHMLGQPVRMVPGSAFTTVRVNGHPISREVRWPDPRDGASPRPDVLWLRQSHARAAAALEPTGYQPIPSQHQDAADLVRLAVRLYRRAVLELGWEGIAEAERAEQRSRYPDRESVRGTVHEWARTLGVPLPTIPSGRPRK